MHRNSFSTFALSPLLLAFCLLSGALPTNAQDPSSLGAAGQDAAQAENTNAAHTRRNNPIEPDAGDWKTWVISSGRDYRVPPPPRRTRWPELTSGSFRR